MRLLVPIILFIAALGLFVVYTNPTYQHIKTLQAQYSQYDAVLTQSTQLRAMRDQLLTRQKTFSADDTHALERLLPDNVDNIRLIIDINDIAARYHLQVKGVGVGKSDAGAGQSVTAGKASLGSVDLSFTISASYTDFIAFLQDLERSLRLLDVESIKFSAGEKGINDYSVTVRTYWLR